MRLIKPLFPPASLLKDMDIFVQAKEDSPNRRQIRS
jgi:hypothetical protein